MGDAIRRWKAVGRPRRMEDSQVKNEGRGAEERDRLTSSRHRGGARTPSVPPPSPLSRGEYCEEGKRETTSDPPRSPSPDSRGTTDPTTPPPTPPVAFADGAQADSRHTNIARRLTGVISRRVAALLMLTAMVTETNIVVRTAACA